ncbi:MAG: phage major capsid protein [Oscillospiraceae bacterium]
MTDFTAKAKSREEILAKMTAAIKTDDAEAFTAAFDQMANEIQAQIVADARAAAESNDAAVLAQRGVRQLTTAERDYYNKVINAMRTAKPQAGVTLIDEILPTTVVDEVFKYIRAAHPLLDALNIQNTGAITRFITATTSGVATWGELNDAINSEISGTFADLDMTLNKLFAHMIVHNATLDLGPVWVDRFVREALGEAIAVQAEAAFVDGDGKNKPIGMSRALTGAVDGVYPRKTATAITSIDPVTYGNLLNTLTQAPNGKRRVVNSVLMVVNPTDYFTKVFPATTPRNTSGGFTFDVFPFPTTVIQSAAVPSGRAIVGVATEYLAAAGAGTNGGRLEFDDSVKFLEDCRAYRIKMYANGRPKDANAFVYLDISGLIPYIQQVNVVNAADFIAEG